MASANEDRRRLVRILKLAYSAEKAAAYAYRGHWRSVSDPGEKDAIRKIEDDEWRHREHVGEMLRELGETPGRFRDWRAAVLGRILGFSCHVTGWLIAMYGAGKLESRNVREYENAARWAWGCGRTEWTDDLLEMAEVEWDHERYFRDRVMKHRLGRRLPRWTPPPPRENIRTSFEQDTRGAPAAPPKSPAVAPEG